MESLSNTVNQVDLRTVHSSKTGYTFFPRTHGLFSRNKHMLKHTPCLNTFKNIKLILTILSTIMELKIAINNKEI